MHHESFDQERIFIEDVEPIVDKLMEKCREHGIPLLLYACYEMDARDEAVYVGGRVVLQGKSARMPLTMVAAKNLLHGDTPIHRAATRLILAASPAED